MMMWRWMVGGLLAALLVILQGGCRTTWSSARAWKIEVCASVAVDKSPEATDTMIEVSPEPLTESIVKIKGD